MSFLNRLYIKPISMNQKMENGYTHEAHSTSIIIISIDNPLSEKHHSSVHAFSPVSMCTPFMPANV